eukprot:9799478-Ditylum_brightwellii.AAC.1
MATDNNKMGTTMSCRVVGFVVGLTTPFKAVVVAFAVNSTTVGIPFGGRGGVLIGRIGGDGATIGVFATVIKAIAAASKQLCIGCIVIFFGRGGSDGGVMEVSEDSASNYLLRFPLLDVESFDATGCAKIQNIMGNFIVVTRGNDVLCQAVFQLIAICGTGGSFVPTQKESAHVVT